MAINYDQDAAVDLATFQQLLDKLEGSKKTPTASKSLLKAVAMCTHKALLL